MTSFLAEGTSPSEILKDVSQLTQAITQVSTADVGTMRLSKHIIQGKVAKKVAGVEYAAQAGYHWRALSLVIKQGGAARPTLTLIQRNKHGI